MPAKQYQMTDRQNKIACLCDGERTSKQIAEMAGDSVKYVQYTMKKWGLPRRAQGSATGSLNGSFAGGRRIDRDGYVIVSAPIGHTSARKIRPDRKTGLIYEHRFLMEKKIGRCLSAGETVDHIDGLRMHNDPSNLRLFSSNSDHLKATIKGHVPNWSAEGRRRMSLPHHLRKDLPPLHIYNQMKKSGDARLIQILRLASELGKDSPFLLGSCHHLKKAGISDLSHSNLERELEKIYQRYA